MSYIETAARAGKEAAPKQRINPSPGAERMRRWRKRRRQGLEIVNFDVAPEAIGKLVRLGWLPATRREDKDAITTALIELAERGIELELRPGSSRA